jgi:hypothetical protein
LYGKASPIAELLCPGGLLPVQRVDDTFLRGACDVSVGPFAGLTLRQGSGGGRSLARSSARGRALRSRS